MKKLILALALAGCLETRAQTIDKAEYFLDNDPGVGKGTPIPIGAAESVDFSFNVPVTSLGDGVHNLFFRAHASTGQWGLHEKRTFLIQKLPVDATAISAAEYFFDADPGIGNGTRLAITPGPESTVNVAIPTPALQPGFHNLYLRLQTGNSWGLHEKRGFYISAPAVDAGNVVAAEYFFDNDPGIGNGVPLVVSAPGASVSQSFSVGIPDGTSDGKHFVFIRTRNAEGKWSLFDFAEIRVDRALPVTGMELSATKTKANTALLTWLTYTEINNSHFEIERSKNGVHFETIGKVEGQGNSTETNHYRFEDQNPDTGMKYYRIRQVDLDGTTAHSRIVNLYFEDHTKELVVYPNPASDMLNLNAGSLRSDVVISIFNQAGQMVRMEKQKSSELIRLDIKTLGQGMYHVRLSDGLTSQSAGFVKN
jgi:hypothetical protein